MGQRVQETIPSGRFSILRRALQVLHFSAGSTMVPADSCSGGFRRAYTSIICFPARGTKGVSRGWTDYTDFVRAPAGNPAEQERLGFDEFCTGCPIGTPGLRSAIARDLSHRALEAGIERQEILDIKMTRWRDELERGLLELGKNAVEIVADGPVCSLEARVGMSAALNRGRAIPLD